MKRPRVALRLQDMADMELLLVLEEALGDGGSAYAVDAARLLDEGEDATVSVGQRFAWLRRWGILESDGGQPARWSFTREGERLLHGRALSDRQREQIEALKTDRPFAVARILGSTQASAEAEKMLDRELRYWKVRR